MEAKKAAKQKARELAKKVAGMERLAASQSGMHAHILIVVIILFYSSTAERKKTKETYQDSLQDVVTVRQQASVSYSLFIFCVTYICLPNKCGIGKSKIG